MPDRFPFDMQFGDGVNPVVASARRRPGPSQAKAAAVRFRYPRLEELSDPESPPPPAIPPEPAAPPEPTFSAGELAGAVALARQEAEAETEARVRAEMLANLEHRQAEALAAIAEGLAASQAALDRTLTARAGASRDLALAVARALVAKALARQPLADIEAMFREVVVRLEGVPWLELRLAPDLVPAGQAALTQAAEAADYRGEIRVIPDARLGRGDARLIWQDGSAERDLARLEDEVTALVETWLPAACPAPGDGLGARGEAAGETRAPAEAPPSPIDRDDARTDGIA